MSFASEVGKKTAIIVSESITGATPSAFYAHQTERDESLAIANDLSEAGIDIIVGSGKNIMHRSFAGTSSYEKLKIKGYDTINTVDELMLSEADKIVAILDDSVTRPVLDGRGTYLSSVFRKVTGILNKNSKGFFMMLEGSKIDGGGHSNNLPMLITESLDFDQVVGEALRFADEDGETLVVVTADHECGGLTLLNGDIERGEVTAEFATNDHTGIPVPVYAYGVHANDFKGIYQNTELFKKMLSLLKSAK
jgi:alkaline phosphatase